MCCVPPRPREARGDAPGARGPVAGPRRPKHRLQRPPGPFRGPDPRPPPFVCEGAIPRGRRALDGGVCPRVGEPGRLAARLDPFGGGIPGAGGASGGVRARGPGFPPDPRPRAPPTGGNPPPCCTQPARGVQTKEEELYRSSSRRGADDTSTARPRDGPAPARDRRPGRRRPRPPRRRPRRRRRRARARRGGPAGRGLGAAGRGAAGSRLEHLGSRRGTDRRAPRASFPPPRP